MQEIILIGRHGLQNALLADLVRQHRNESVRIGSVSDALQVPKDSVALFLIDLGSHSLQELYGILLALHHDRVPRPIALFNAHPDVSMHQLISFAGVKGVFGSDTSQTDFIKGVAAMCAGEYWLPRKLLWSHLEKTRGKLKSASAIELTQRERKIALLLTEGSSNVTIAGQLNLSPHTVKTHLYNLFRKLNVSNRTQAANWAREHLDHVPLE